MHPSDDGTQDGLSTEAAAYHALTEIALTDQPLDDILEQVSALAKQVLSGTPETSVTLVTGDQTRTAAFTGDVALQLDERQYDDGYGPCLDAAVSGGTIQVTTNDADAAYPDFRRAAQQQGVTHSLSVGLPAAGRIIGALNLYSTTTEPLTTESARIAGTFAGFAGMLLSTIGHSDNAAETAADLQQALQTRTVIGQAQGILMARHHCSQEQAFTALVQLSQQQGVRLQEAAKTLVINAATA
jgi:GAF domain-containing protein